MRFILLIICLFCLIPFCGCSNSESASAEKPYEVESDSLAGMVRIKSNGLFALLGTNDSAARLKERPQMKVAFDYDFSMGRHEVTCGEFNAFAKNSMGFALKCADDSLPATNVTYFDAVLYANARSKAEGYDTAYTYSSATFDSEKHCTGLEGFVYHPEKAAFRLPTEAEWMLVAESRWDLSAGWTADNSDNRLHGVCSASGKKEDVCDMVGNAVEWVNDWLGYFSDTSVTNYVGAPDGGSLGERILKGGSYRDASSSISLYSRGDVYTVTSSMRADYVGFRLAFGAIPDAVWMGNDGKMTASRTVLQANVAALHSLAGTYNVKLAFRNEISGNLSYVDYSNAEAVVEIVDTLDVYHPDISPDGNRVAFCTRYEGISGKSELYVRDLNANGTNRVKLDVESAAVPRWRVLDNGDTVIVYVTDAGSNQDEASFKAASTWQVKFENGKFGTPQKLFDGAYHGGVGAGDALAVTGSKLLRTRIFDESSKSARDTVWYGGEQACNVSLSTDGSKRTLFLDFSSSKGRKFVGARYSTHERVLIADSAGNLLTSVAAPAGYTFDHTEWVNGSNLFVASLTNIEGVHSKIVLVNVQDSSVLDLVEGDELWHPCFWVNLNSAHKVYSMVNPDSAGAYYTSSGSDRSKILRYRMELMWKYKDSVDVVVLGSSRSSNGINVGKLSRPAINLSYFPSSMFDISEFYLRYVQGNFKRLKYVVVSLDLDSWNYYKESCFFSLEYKLFPGYVYDENHNYWKGSDYSEIYEATRDGLGVEVYRNMFLNMESSVFAPTVGWGSTDFHDSTWMDEDRAVYEQAYDAWVDFLNQTKKDGLVVIGIIFPQSPAYRQTGVFGRYGMRRSEAVDVIDSLSRLEKKYDHFVFMDENKMGDHDYDDSMAQDCDHLIASGAIRLTARLDSVIQNRK